MQSRKEYIETLRKGLQRGLEGAKTDFIDENGKFHLEWFSDAGSVMSIAGKEELWELVSDIFEMLECKSPELRGEAIITLSFDTKLQSPEAKDIAYKMWLEDEDEDEDEDVRGRALRAWTAFYTNAKDPKILKKLYEIIKSKNHPVAHRFEALRNIYAVSKVKSESYNPYSRKFCDYPEKTHEEFEQLVDWQEVESILKKYAPGVLKDSN